MLNPEKPKRHHYVPRCYLNQFLDDSNHIYTLDVRKVQQGFKEGSKENHPNKICLDENFYSIKPEHLGTSFKLEQFDELYVESSVLHTLETRYMEVFRSVTLGQELPIIDAVYLCDFIIQMKIRNPYWIKEVIEKNKDQWIDESIQKIIDEKGENNIHFKRLPPAIRQFVIENVRQEQKSNQTFAKQMQLFGLIQRSGIDNERNEKYRNTLLNYKWKILWVPTNLPLLVTSDNPGFAKSLDGSIRNSYFQDYSAFYFPLSPHYCLLIDGFEQDNAYTVGSQYKQITSVQLNADQIILINNHTIQRINKLVIAKDRWYINQIAELNNPNKGNTLASFSIS